jgi:tetratricopeptide (TPR) repeat protein
VTGIPRTELSNCELRASASGFSSSDVMLAGLVLSGGSIDVGSILVQRTSKPTGATLNAAAYKAPKDARRAYEKGLAAEKDGKLPDAAGHFEKAVQLYPQYAHAWFQLGTVLQKENQQDAARAAYVHATTVDTRFLPPYLSLAVMAYEAANWTEVLTLTNHVLDLDPMSHTPGYFVDLDPLNCAEAYFYNAVANYQLHKIDEAEKSAVKAEQRADLPAHFPQLHLLLADIFAQKKSYASAITELQAYLELVPQAKDVNQVREHMAKLEKLNASMSTNERPTQQ